MAQDVGSVFRYQYRVTYADCAPGNHVYYSRYLEILESARGEFFRAIGVPFFELQQQDTIFPAVECHLRYKAPARYDDLLTGEIWLISLERVRLNFGYRIVDQSGRDILLAATLHACTSQDEKLKRLPETLKLKLQPYVRQPESRR